MKYLGLIVLVEAVCVAIAIIKGREWLRVLAVANMLLIAVTVKKLFDFGFGVSNIANLFFATVLLIQSLIYFRYGMKAAQRTIYVILWADIAFIALGLLTIYAQPYVEGNEEISLAYNTVAETSPLPITASFLSFYCSNQILLTTLHVTRKRARTLASYLLAIVSAQVIDTLIFFPMVFGNGVLTKSVVEIAGVGFMVKIIAGIILSPLLFYGQAQKMREGR